MVEKGGGGGGGDRRRGNRYIEKERDMDKKRERAGEKIDTFKRREIWIRRETEDGR